MIAGLESLLFALGAVLSSLHDPVRIVAYAIGVASGTLLGMLADERSPRAVAGAAGRRWAGRGAHGR
ncbi:MAG: DUF5698 domain-containing protein [Egibacteraceae bacterium]